MKNLILFLSIYLLISCNSSDNTLIVQTDKWEIHNKNTFLYNRANVIYSFPFKTSESPEWYGNFDHKPLLNELFQQVLSGKLIVYEPSSALTDTLQRIDLKSINDRLDIEGNSKIELTEIKSAGFNEDWFFDPDSNKMEKKVINWFPVRHFYKNTDSLKTEEVMRQVFLVANNTKPQETQYNLLAKNIISEFPFSETSSTYHKGVNFDNFVKTLINNVLTNKLQAFNYSCLNDRKFEELKPDEIKQIIDKQLYNDFSLITLFLFDEDWYYNKQFFELKKIVNGIVLVKEYYKSPEDDEIIKKMLFYIKLK